MSSKTRDPRPGWDEYFMEIAKVVALRSNCSRRHVAAVIVRNRHILSTGYNGTPHGVTNCFAGGCPRCAHTTKSGDHLEECLCVHAEQNAICQAALHGHAIEGATIYVTISPCLTCAKLIINSGIKFTDRGEVVLRVGVAEETSDDVLLRFSVTDTGIGIKPENLNKLFTAFVQVDGSNTRRYGGSGLGLSISKQLAELLGGTVGVNSEFGKGSEFWFTARFAKRKASDGKAVSMDIAGLRVLVIDDYPVNKMLLSNMLTSCGCRFSTAKNADEGVEILKDGVRARDPYRIAILDFMLPEIDGKRLAEKIKADPMIDATRIIMVTPLTSRGDSGWMKEVGVAGCLTKPLRLAQLHNYLAVVSGISRIPISQSYVTRYQVDMSQQVEKRLLLVEDNLTNQRVAVAMLKKMGFKTDVASSGELGLQMLNDKSYDLVFMDCQMPGMDGFETTKHIRNGAAGAQNVKIPIIAMTANAMSGDREKCLKSGMDDYISKPVQPKTLMELLVKWLSKKEENGNQNEAPNQQSAAAPAESALPVIEMEGLLENMAGDEELVKEILDTFKEDAASIVESLRTAINEGHNNEAQLHSHSLKGASANVKATELYTVAKELNDYYKASQFDKAPECFKRVEAAYERLLNELSK